MSEDSCFYVRKRNQILKPGFSIANTKVLLEEGLSDCYLITVFNVVLSTLACKTLDHEIKGTVRKFSLPLGG